MSKPSTNKFQRLVVREFPDENCDRCDKKSSSHIMSMFNTDWICFSCLEEERQHPDYPKARAAELAEVRKGNFNFPGIGKPSDL